MFTIQNEAPRDSPWLGCYNLHAMGLHKDYTCHGLIQQEYIMQNTDGAKWECIISHPPCQNKKFSVRLHVNRMDEHFTSSYNCSKYNCVSIQKIINIRYAAWTQLRCTVYPSAKQMLSINSLFKIRFIYTQFVAISFWLFNNAT